MSEEVQAVPPLRGSHVRELRARAHALKPVVWIAGNGTSESVLREIDRSLSAHELIKVHAAVDGRREREALLTELCAGLSAHPVQIIGKMLVLFRPRPDAPPPPAPVGEKSVRPRKIARARSGTAAGSEASRPRRVAPGRKSPIRRSPR